MSLVPFTFGPAFQDSMLALMLTDLGFAEKCLKYVDEEHLCSEGHKWLYGEIERKYRAKGTVPSFEELEENLRKIERHKRRMFKVFALKIFDYSPADPEFIKVKLTEFAKRTNFADLFALGQTLYNAGKVKEAYDYVMEAIAHVHAVTFDDDQIIPIEDFSSLRDRYLAQRMIAADCIPTGIPPLDKILQGGLSKLEGELGVILAEPKRGKSVALIHMGCCALLMRTGRVAHVVLEGSTETTVFRYQSRLTGIPAERIKSGELHPDEEKRLDAVGKKYLGRLDLIPFNKHWEYTTNDVEARLKELDRKGKTPDLCVIDYADLLHPREKSREERINQREVYRELKRLALMRKMATWTASQAVRPKTEAEKEVTLKGASVAESFEKVRIADFIGSLNQTPREAHMGIMRFHADVYRNNPCDRTIRLIIDFERMVFHKATLSYIKKEDYPEWMKTRRLK